MNEYIYNERELQIIKANIPKKLLKEVEKNSSIEEVVFSISIYKTIACELVASNSECYAEIIDSTDKGKGHIPCETWLNTSYSSVGFSTIMNTGHAYLWEKDVVNSEPIPRVELYKGTLIITKNILDKISNIPNPSPTQEELIKKVSRKDEQLKVTAEELNLYISSHVANDPDQRLIVKDMRTDASTHFKNRDKRVPTYIEYNEALKVIQPGRKIGRKSIINT